ncbi:MAG TPA: SMP-30/gluconolactonase/LRE family protein [Phycisphaerae bacterium]|nr:SMP-30/gluconolactonase/LRE family protein [Phycisphaerae bacterium]
MRTSIRGAGWIVLGCCLCGAPALAKQPAVAPGPNEPNWSDLLKQQWGLDMDRDLRNPALEGASPAGQFKRADRKKPVTFRPIIALGLETATRGGWYAAGAKTGDLPEDAARSRRLLWAYAFKNSADDQKSGRYAGPPLDPDVVEFEPGDEAFGLWVGNDNFDDGGVYTQPGLVAKVNSRLKAQPYKAMIYPNIDAKTGRLIPGSYLIGWEYSTNDDFQDVVTRIDNVELLASEPPLPGIVAPDAEARKLAGGFQFIEGPAWDFKRSALYFSDIPPARIIRYADGEATVALEASGKSNGLMFDREAKLVACEGGSRRISRGEPGRLGEEIAGRWDGKRFNSPNDLWLDAAGGLYFTDPRYGSREGLEQDKEAVYYVAADGTVKRVIDDLVRPNGIAMSPDGKTLYVVDNGADHLWRYAIEGTGVLCKGERIAFVEHPDGMTVDAEGRLHITSRQGISVFDAGGKWIGRLPVPEVPANCTFGGPGNRTLFITARTSLYAVETLTRGWHVHLDGPPKASTSGPVR